jgi:hypothetical protein
MISARKTKVDVAYFPKNKKVIDRLKSVFLYTGIAILLTKNSISYFSARLYYMLWITILFCLLAHGIIFSMTHLSMTTLENAIAERNLSLYSVIKKIGKNPTASWANEKRKVQGKRKIRLEELHVYCEAISLLCEDKPLSVADLDYDVEEVQIL